MAAVPGDYVVRVTHKGTLLGATQSYALAWRGARRITATGIPTGGQTPSFRIHEVVPHPVHTRSRVAFALDRSAPVTIRMYDVGGRPVATLLDGSPRPAGESAVEIDAGALASGVYFLRITAAGRTLTRKVTVVK
jgi:hypothetical protein